MHHVQDARHRPLFPSDIGSYSQAGGTMDWALAEWGVEDFNQVLSASEKSGARATVKVEMIDFMNVYWMQG
ncbi:unnamed protein product [Linum trigynum]|uniref:Uncharacterized protein n=1 Tax=Linum trigynum TaxID=586398 RepID=A0AAV2CZ94_9ROSI